VPLRGVCHYHGRRLIVSLQQAGELGEEEASERLDGMGQSGASILPRKTAGPMSCFDKGNN
jgi:hypothetical protein